MRPGRSHWRCAMSTHALHGGSVALPRPELHVAGLTAVAGLIILGLGALAGGLALVTAPDGSNMGFDVGLLAGSPFDDYLIPGLILGGLFGVGSLARGGDGPATLASGAVSRVVDRLRADGLDRGRAGDHQGVQLSPPGDVPPRAPDRGRLGALGLADLPRLARITLTVCRCVPRASGQDLPSVVSCGFSNS